MQMLRSHRVHQGAVVLQAPRGTILDRNGKLLVDNRAALSIQAIPAKMPKRPRALDHLYNRLNFLLHTSPAKHPCRVGRRAEQMVAGVLGMEGGRKVLVLAPIVLRRMARRESGSSVAKRREKALQRVG